jgi:hypothetical protein
MPDEMPKALKRWESTRQQGKVKFILLSGVLSWGMPMFAVMTFVVNRQSDQREQPGWMILVSAAIWALGGALFGFTLWTISEKRYQKYLASNPPQVPPPLQSPPDAA